MLRSQQEDAEEALIWALNEALGIFGETVRSAIYARLERDCGLRRKEVLKNPPLLARGLQTIFGSAFTTIEHLVRRTLNSEFGIQMVEGSSLLVMIETVKERKHPATRG